MLVPALLLLWPIRPAAAVQNWSRENIAVELPASGGRAPERFAGLLKLPAQAAHPLPALIVLGGVETGAGVLDLLEPEEAVLLATFEYPYAGPRKFKFPRTLIDAHAIKKAAGRTPAFVSALARALRARPGVDPAKVCVVGASFGAPFVLRAAADDPDIKCIVIVEGFADVKGTAAARMRRLWKKRLGPLTRPSAWLLSRLLSLYLRPPRPENDAARLRADQRVLFIEAAQDTIIPASSRDLLWRSLLGSQARLSRRVIPGEHLMAGRSKEAIREIITIVARWLPAA